MYDISGTRMLFLRIFAAVVGFTLGVMMWLAIPHTVHAEEAPAPAADCAELL